MTEKFSEQIRKKVLDMKTDFTGFYTETYNLVAVLLRLNIDVELDPVRDKMIMVYRQPSPKYNFGLPHLEAMYFKFKEEPNLKIRGSYIDFNEIKTILDKTRRDLLFYLALIEDKPKDYGIILEQNTKEDL